MPASPTNQPFQQMRADCAREFGRLQAEAESHKEFREQVRNDLNEIKQSLDNLHESQTQTWKDRALTGGTGGGVLGAVYVLVELLKSGI
jgi:hypothetical protein